MVLHIRLVHAFVTKNNCQTNLLTLLTKTGMYEDLPE